MSTQRRKTVQKPREEQAPQPLQVQPDYSKEFPRFYSNIAVVSHTMSDLCIDFCLAAPPYKVDENNQTVSQEVVARVVVPSDMVEGMVRALSSQLKSLQQDRERGGIDIPIEKQESGHAA